MNRASIINLINKSGLAQHMTTLQKVLLDGAVRKLTPGDVTDDLAEPKDRTKQRDRFLLNSVGPAAASSAIEYATNHCNKAKQLESVSHKLNGSFVANMRLIENESTPGEYQTYSNVLRQYLLPRYAYLDFDNMVDPRHRIDEECGYPKFITPVMYRYMYDRDDVARRVVDIYPDECWAMDPEVYEDEDENNWTPFELAWKELCETHDLLSMLYRIDKLCGIGHYGALLIGVDDGLDLDMPIQEFDLLTGKRGTVATKRRELLYMRPFDEYLSFVQQFDTNPLSPRYGMPVYYNLVFVDMTTAAAGASVGTRVNRRVHWSRVSHVVDNPNTSLVYGTPRQQPVFNRELDLRKIKGGSGEMFWKGGFPGISFEVDPQFVADDPDYDEEDLIRQVEEYSNGLKRYITALGVKAHTLDVQIAANPEKYVNLQLSAIAMNLNIPMRIFAGSEQGKLSSSQDKLTWNQRVGKRIKRFVNTGLLRNVIDRFIAIGVLPKPPKGYMIEWPDLNTPTDEDKANLCLKWTQAISQYVASGMVHLIPPMEYFTVIVGLPPSQAKRIVDLAKSAGGFDKLTKVDPSQGAGVNGVRENNVSKGDKEGTTRTRPKKRRTADKKAEGTAS